MKNPSSEVKVEKPRRPGEEAEFFIQKNEPRTVACEAHIHNAVELIYVKSGSYRVILDGEEYEIESGDLTLFCSNSIHYVIAQNCPVNEYYVIKIPPSFFLEFSRREMGAEYIMRFANARPGRRVLWRREELEGCEILGVLGQLIAEHEAQRYAVEVAIRLKIMELLLAILRDSDRETALPSDRTAELIWSVMLRVRRSFSEDFDERAMAAEVGMSYSYFSRSFRRVAGTSFRKYLNVIRIRKAEQMLAAGGDSITEVAMRCGYNSPSYFINVYRAVTGKTPYHALCERRD